MYSIVNEKSSTNNIFVAFLNLSIISKIIMKYKDVISSYIIINNTIIYYLYSKDIVLNFIYCFLNNLI